MNVLAYTWFPVLRNEQSGGTQQVVRDLIVALSCAGLTLTVICPEAPRDVLLSETPNLRILPVLKHPYVRPLFPYERVHNLQEITRALEGVDVIWSIDQPFPLEVQQPVVLRLDNFSYEGEVMSFMSLSWDVLAVVSPYLGDIANAIAGPEFWEGAPRPIHVIPNGVDTSFFAPSDPSALLKRLGLVDSERYLLFPHRPDPYKGFSTALNVMCGLLEMGESYKLLIPRLSESSSSRALYQQLRHQIQRRHLDEVVILHDWLSLSDLPAYYSLGAFCLALSKLPEGNGMTPVQAVSCRTPLITTRAGGLRDLFPVGSGIQYVGFDAVAEVVTAILRRPSDIELERGRDFIRLSHSLEHSVKMHLACFQAARKGSGVYRPVSRVGNLRLAPWCHLDRSGTVWHDYFMRSYRLSSNRAALIRMAVEGRDFSASVRSSKDFEFLHNRAILIDY